MHAQADMTPQVLCAADMFYVFLSLSGAVHERELSVSLRKDDRFRDHSTTVGMGSTSVRANQGRSQRVG